MLLWKLIQKAVASPSIRLLSAMSLAIVFLGVVFFHVQEGLRWLDALYFTVITLTTVGYGDFSPQTDLGKLFTIAYVLIGLGVIAAFIGTISGLAVELTQEGERSS
jgi:voltage-gated potassium channel